MDETEHCVKSEILAWPDRVRDFHGRWMALPEFFVHWGGFDSFCHLRRANHGYNLGRHGMKMECWQQIVCDERA